MSGDMSGTSDLANQLLKLSRILAMSKKHGMTYAVWDRDISNTEAAATALEAKEAEIAALRAETATLRDMLLHPDPDQEPDNVRLHREKCDALDRALVAEVRAETAERKLAEARAALKRIEPLTQNDFLTEPERLLAIRTIACADISKADCAARAVIEQGE